MNIFTFLHVRFSYKKIRNFKAILIFTSIKYAIQLAALKREPYIKGESQLVMAWGISKNWPQQNILIFAVISFKYDSKV